LKDKTEAAYRRGTALFNVAPIAFISVERGSGKTRALDTVFGPKAKNNEEIRGLLNAVVAAVP
jgi:hypothetical protein